MRAPVTLTTRTELHLTKVATSTTSAFGAPQVINGAVTVMGQTRRCLPVRRSIRKPRYRP